MQEFLEKLSKGELQDEQIKEFESKLSDSGKNVLKEALAFVSKRQDEATKLSEMEKFKLKLQEDVRLEQERFDNLKKSGNQFKEEQLEIAWSKFSSEYKIPAEQKDDYLTKAKTLGGDRATSELWFSDLVGVYAFKNKDSLLQAENEKREMERKASEQSERDAGGGGVYSEGGKEKKFSNEAIDLAKRAGISEEAADRQIKEGLQRTLG